MTDLLSWLRSVEMKMKNSYIALATAAAVVMFAAAFYYTYIFNHSCRNLYAISHDKVLMTNLWGQLTKIIEEQAQLENASPRRSTGYVRDFEGKFNVDWEELGIPEGYATMIFSGEGFSHREFVPPLIDEIRVGYGYRDHLVFSVKEGPESRSQDPSQWSFDLSVECKS